MWKHGFRQTRPAAASAILYRRPMANGVFEYQTRIRIGVQLGLPEPTSPQRTSASIAGPDDVLLAILEDAGSTTGQVLRSLGVLSKEHFKL
jgi:hypothetical protein